MQQPGDWPGERGRYTGTATCNTTLTASNATGTSQHTIGIIVSGYYSRNDANDNDVIEVAQPLPSSFITVMSKSAGQYPDTVGSKANFTGKANIQDITNPSNPVPVDGNATLQMWLTDNGEPGTKDTLGIQVLSKNGGTWFSSNWSGSKTSSKIWAAGISW
jgi:hypothetical protein